VAELSLFEEMRELAITHPELKPEFILQMATKNSAAALGMPKQIGELIPDAQADLIAVPYAGKIADAAKAVVNHRGNVAASMIGGNWAVEPAAIFP
jgi:cytosine/adenosine deaminase-related metal-dependent hydrolase